MPVDLEIRGDCTQSEITERADVSLFMFEPAFPVFIGYSETYYIRM